MEIPDSVSRAGSMGRGGMQRQAGGVNLFREAIKGAAKDSVQREEQNFRPNYDSRGNILPPSLPQKTGVQGNMELQGNKSSLSNMASQDLESMAARQFDEQKGGEELGRREGQWGGQGYGSARGEGRGGMNPSGAPQEGYGRREERHGGGNTYGREEPSYGRGEPSYGRGEEQRGRREERHHGRREEQSYGRREESHGRREESYGKRDEQPYARREEQPQARREEQDWGHSSGSRSSVGRESGGRKPEAPAWGGAGGRGRAGPSGESRKSAGDRRMERLEIVKNPFDPSLKETSRLDAETAAIPGKPPPPAPGAPLCIGPVTVHATS